MKATMETYMDTVWGNEVRLRVECALDNPHAISATRLSELMIQRLKLMVEEVRHTNERAAPDYLHELEEARPGTESAHEGRAWEELQAERRRDREHREEGRTRAEQEQ